MNTPTSAQPQTPQTPSRTSLSATCPDYNEARKHLQVAMQKSPFAWVEAIPMPQDVVVWPARPNDTAYAIHSAQNERDVPPFAIEVYEQGALSRYETDRQKITELAQMPELDRQSILRALDAHVEIRQNPTHNAMRQGASLRA